MKRRIIRDRIIGLLTNAANANIHLMDIRSGTFVSTDGVREQWLKKSDTKVKITYTKSRREKVLLFWNSCLGDITSHKFEFKVSSDKKKLLKEINKIFKPNLIKFKNIEITGCTEEYSAYSDNDCGEISITGDIEVLFSRNALKATIKNLSKFINDSWSTGHMLDDGTRMCRIHLNPKVMGFIERYYLQKEFHNEIMKHCRDTVYNINLTKHDNTHTYILNYIPKKDVVKILDK